MVCELEHSYRWNQAARILQGRGSGPPDCSLECAVVEELEEYKQIVCTALGLAEQEKKDCESGGGS